MALESIIKMSKLKCNLDKGYQTLFFSLVDYRNNLFNSNDPKKVMEFYDGFENREPLILYRNIKFTKPSIPYPIVRQEQ